MLFQDNRATPAVLAFFRETRGEMTLPPWEDEGEEVGEMELFPEDWGGGSGTELENEEDDSRPS